jgi:hypothetical protein
MKTLKLGTLALALAAALALSSTAFAKGGTGGGGTGGGGGGGGASCVQILDFSLTPGTDPTQPTVTTTYTVTNACVDHENMSVAAIDYANGTTGFVGRAVWMLPYGPTTFSSTAPAVPGQTLTETLTVYTPGGKVGETRTLSATFPTS